MSKAKRRGSSKKVAKASKAALVTQPEALALEQAKITDDARGYAQAAKAKATRDAYASDWRGFVTWCKRHGLSPLPASGETVAAYVTHLAGECDTEACCGPRPGRKVSTIERALASISQAHKAGAQPSPRGTAPVREVMQGIKRTHGTAPAQKAPVLVAELRAMVATLPKTLIGQRDRALLLLGFAGAFRRAELVALDVGDVTFTGDGLEVNVRRSKTDTEGAGAKVGVPYGSDVATCPVRALRDGWLEAAGLTEGALFVGLTRWGRFTGKRLSGRDAARVVQRTAKSAGLNPKLYGGHSLRAGLATSAAKAGKSERAIMAQGRWRSVTMARRYIRDANLFTDNAAAGIGL